MALTNRPMTAPNTQIGSTVAKTAPRSLCVDTCSSQASPPNIFLFLCPQRLQKSKQRGAQARRGRDKILADALIGAKLTRNGSRQAATPLNRQVKSLWDWRHVASANGVGALTAAALLNAAS